MKYKKFSIIVPILNEEKNIITLVNQIKKNLIEYKENYELIFVDDSSVDNSRILINNLIKKNKFIKLIHRVEERDLSKSCILGFQNANSEIISVMDGDLQHSPKDLKKMLKVFFNSDLDVLIGVRNFNDQKVGLNIFRKISSKIIVIIINILLGKRTSDPLSGFFIFKKKIFNENKKKLFSRGFKILSDVIYSSKKNLVLKDYKINFNYRNAEKSKMRFKVLIVLIVFILKTFILRIFYK
jgi:dolichol-phosphate mannosyltransferase